jgi:hypothetical protein
MYRQLKSLKQILKFTTSTLKSWGALAFLVTPLGCAAQSLKGPLPLAPTHQATAKDKKIEMNQSWDLFITGIIDKQQKVWLTEFRQAFADTDHFSITERDDRYEIIVSHQSANGHTGGAEAYRVDKKNGKSEMLWHEHPIKISERDVSTIDSRIPWNPQSRSIILNSKVIFTFTCDSLEPLFPMSDMPHGYNPWSLKGTIQTVHKGTLSKEKSESFETEVKIYVGPVRSRPVGIWFGFDPCELPQRGESWVIFCSPKEEGINPADLLRGQGVGCTAYRSQEVKDDLDLATQIIENRLELKPALTLAKEKISTAGPVFLSFLWEYFGETAVKDPDSFEPFLSILENPALKSTSRITLINDLESFFSLNDGTPDITKSADRFIVSLFRLLKQNEPDNSDLQYNITSTYIPTMLGIGSGLTERPASQVFSGLKKDRNEAIVSLRTSKHKKEAGILLEWIQKK